MCTKIFFKDFSAVIFLWRNHLRTMFKVCSSRFIIIYKSQLNHERNEFVDHIYVIDIVNKIFYLNNNLDFIILLKLQDFLYHILLRYLFILANLIYSNIVVVRSNIVQK